MARRPKSADQADQQEQPAADLAADNSSGGSGETSPPEGGTGVADAASHSTSPADSVSTSAGGEAAPSLQSDAASDDNPPANAQDGPAVPPAEASASAGAHEPEGDGEPAAIPEGWVQVTAKSRDGRPYIRAGVRWGGSLQTEVMSQAAYERLAADPNITIKD